jgi:quercetin dioxygenase-like cupin family protein
MTDDAPRAPYWRLWVDADGVSHQSREAARDFALASIQPPAAPQWLGPETTARTTVRLTILPVGWTGDWHPNPHPQWIVPLSGRWFVESMDGERVEMGPGEMAFGGDQDARAIDGRHGHRSGTVGDAPAVLLLVQYPDGVPPGAPPLP